MNPKRKVSDSYQSDQLKKRARMVLPDVTDLVDTDLAMFRYTDTKARVKDKAFILYCVFREVYMDKGWGKVLDLKFKCSEMCTKAIEAGGELSEVLDKCIRERNWDDLNLLFTETGAFDSGLRLPEPLIQLSNAVTDATLESWQSDYIGDNWKIIKEKADKICQSREEERYYAPIFTLLQSSGMGKSRMMDEYSKHLVIPICLQDSTTGFPPPDNEVFTWLTRKRSRRDSLGHIYAFFHALFTVAKEYLSKFINDIEMSNGTPADLAKMFRGLMSDRVRRDIFYENVIRAAREELQGRVDPNQAKEMMSLDTPLPSSRVHGQPTDKVDISGKTLGQIAARLTDMIQAFTGNSSDTPAFLLSIDEAHNLANGPFGSWTSFVSVRHALHGARQRPIVSVFLSTSGKLQLFLPANKEDPSFVMHEGSLRDFPPVCTLGYDVFAQGFVTSWSYKIADYASIGSMARFGRPLFYQLYQHGIRGEWLLTYAKSKILSSALEMVFDSSSEILVSAYLAILALRLPLDFDASTPSGVQEGFDQVHKHMRLCIYAHDDYAMLHTSQPVEPILAEAACRLVREKHINQAEQLLKILEGTSIHKGDRGELVFMLILLLARDRAVPSEGPPLIKLIDLMKHLLKEEWWESVFDAVPSESESDQEKVPFKEQFKKAHVYLVQFVKVREPLSSLAHLMAAAAKGTAILYNDNAKGIDLLVPFVLDPDKPLTPDNISAILVQVKNDRRYQTVSSGIPLFHSMDPFDEHYGLFTYAENAKYPAIIRMVISLASESPGVSFVSPSTRKSPCIHKHTADLNIYDIWCAGASSKTFRVIDPNEDKTYEKLLKLNKKPSANDEGATSMDLELQMSMYPMGFADPACWLASSQVDLCRR